MKSKGLKKRLHHVYNSFQDPDVDYFSVVLFSDPLIKAIFL